jgi:hypothetical protein
MTQRHLDQRRFLACAAALSAQAQGKTRLIVLGTKGGRRR